MTCSRSRTSRAIFNRTEFAPMSMATSVGMGWDAFAEFGTVNGYALLRAGGLGFRTAPHRRGMGDGLASAFLHSQQNSRGLGADALRFQEARTCAGAQGRPQ